MTTSKASNVHAVAINGNFDDCQNLVKAMFNDAPFREKVALSGVNSINWARIMAQVVYYFTTAVALGGPDRKISFTVPTGNFGDIFAGYVAKKMGLPIDRLVVATNENDILARTLKTGRYEMRDVKATTSPSMDIGVSSNFERLLFEAYDRDAAKVRRAMEGLKQSGAFEIEEKGAEDDPPRVPRRPRHGRGRRRDDRQDAGRYRLSARPPYRHRRACGQPIREGRFPHGDARHRASGEIPGSGKIRIRY